MCAQAVADHIPQLVQGVRGSQAKPEDLSAQLALIIASQNFLQVQQFLFYFIFLLYSDRLDEPCPQTLSNFSPTFGTRLKL